MDYLNNKIETGTTEKLAQPSSDSNIANTADSESVTKNNFWWSIAFVVVNAINPLLAMCLQDASVQLKSFLTIAGSRLHPVLFS